MSARKPEAPEAIVMGASAGALEALFSILPALPENYPLPVMIVVHIPFDKKSVMAELCQTKCQLKVVEAEDKEPIKGSHVYFAPPDYHMMVDSKQQLSLSNDEPVLYSRPSIDVLFESAAEVYGSKLIGIILTGANNDGAHGMKVITAVGGIGIVQRPDTAYAAAMPKAALKISPEALCLSLEQISDYLQKVASS